MNKLPHLSHVDLLTVEDQEGPEELSPNMFLKLESLRPRRSYLLQKKHSVFTGWVGLSSWLSAIETLPVAPRLRQLAFPPSVVGLLTVVLTLLYLKPAVYSRTLGYCSP